MDKSKLTIIIPVYNCQDLLKRALDSVPLSTEYQYILIDDGSSDNSFEILTTWAKIHRLQMGAYIIKHWEENKGIAYSMNYAFDNAIGEYIVSLSSDDYFIKNFSSIMPYLDGKNDLVYFDLQINNGEIWHLDNESKNKYVGAVKFIRRKFLGNIRIPNLKYREDVPFSQKLYAKKPKEVFTGIILKHYNYPRVGSLTWEACHDKHN